MAMRGSAASGSPWDPVQRQSDLLRRVVADIAVADLEPWRDPQVPEPLGNLRRLLHAAADERDLALELVGQVRR